LPHHGIHHLSSFYPIGITPFTESLIFSPSKKTIKGSYLISVFLKRFGGLTNQNKKTELTAGLSFGSSAIFVKRPVAFRLLLTEGLALSGLNSIWIFLFGRPLKHSSQKVDMKLLMELNFKRKILSCEVGILKVFLNLPPPFRREKVF